MVNPRDLCFDIETYPNCFTCVIVHVETDHRWIFEISDRVNQSQELYAMLYQLRAGNYRMVGFNNIGFDYPVLHYFVNLVSAQGYATAQQLAAKAQQIIGSENRWANIVWPDQRIVEQVDLYSIHHFDNPAKSTGLKALEINMRSHTVEDLPYDPNLPLTLDQTPTLIKYNCHDVNETISFYRHSLRALATRDDLTQRLGVDFTNYNDTKIGKEFFIMELEKRQPGICFDRSTGRKQPRQTWRPEGIRIADVIFPYVRFQDPEFQRVLDYLRTVTITNTKNAPELKDLHATIGDFRFDFGTGGIHGSIEKRIVRSNDEYVIVDCDVASMYPNLAIKNRVYPAHLGEMFCDVYEELYNTRKQYPKKSAENLLYKLALNGVYGDSNNDYGPFKDPQYTMTITINGQLSICMLAESLIRECSAEMIQANTDGISVRIHRSKLDRYYEVCKSWEELTKLDLEYAEYDGMWIRDVNSYLARTMDGKVKRVGAYQHVRPDEPGNPELGWHQDHSALIVPKAAEAVMLNGADLETFIRSHDNAFDFMCRAKVPRSSRLMYGDSQVQNTSRYYISTDGAPLVKIMPPTVKKPDAERRISINAGWNVSICNVLDDWDWSKLDYRWYVEETKKLILTNGDV